MIFRLKHTIGPTHPYLKLILTPSAPTLVFKSTLPYSTSACPSIAA
jgi:hypothetical protein